MTTTELPLATRASANRVGLYLSFLQLVFTLLWTAYVIYLPSLAAQVGIAPSAVILILMLDQAIFTITDTTMGIVADRVEALVGRLGVFVGAVTLLSCAAFAALPFVAGVVRAHGGSRGRPAEELPDYAPLLHWAPVACWSVAGCGLLVLAASRGQGAQRI